MAEEAATSRPHGKPNFSGRELAIWAAAASAWIKEQGRDYIQKRDDLT